MARNLNARSNENVGLDQKVWVVTETGGFGAAATGGLVPAATDAIEHVSASVGFTIPREDAAHRSGRSRVKRLSGKKEVSWSFESYIVPADPNGSDEPVLPDCHPMLLSVFGAVTESVSTEKLYTLARAGSYSFRMLEEGTHFSRVAVGCVADSVTFTLPGDGKAMMKFEGFGQDVFVAGSSLLAQAVTGSAVDASLVVQDLTHTADDAGSAGNAISITYTAGATAGAEVVTVSGSAISVQIEDGVSTATQVKAAIDGSTPAAALVDVTITGTGSTAQDAATIAYLAGGLGANDILVTSGEGKRFEVGSYIDVVNVADGDTVTNSARLISAIGTGQNVDVLTVSGAALSAAASGSIIVGHAPAFTATSSENALLGLNGSFTTTEMGSVSCDLLSAEIMVKNNFTPRANSYGTSRICGFLSDKRREVSVKLDVLLSKANWEFYSTYKKFTADNLVITLAPQDIPAPSDNGATGRTLTFTLPKVEFNIPPIEQGSDGFVKITLEGVALSTDINTQGAELSLKIS